MKLAGADAVIADWRKRLGTTQKVEEMLNRQALLYFKQNPKLTYDRIKYILGLHFQHERIVLDQTPNFPTALDPKALQFDIIAKRL